MRRGEVVAESVAERREAGIPEKARHAVESALDTAQVAADDRGLALPRLDVLDVLHKRDDDRLAFVGGESLPYPVIGAQREDARGGVPVDGAPVGVRGMVRGHAGLQHPARLLEVLAFARETPRERTLRRLRAPLLHVLDRRGRRGLVRTACGLHLAELDGTVVRAYRFLGVLVAALQQGVASRARGPFGARLHLRPRLRVEEHPRMVPADGRHPGVVLSGPHAHHARRACRDYKAYGQLPFLHRLHTFHLSRNGNCLLWGQPSNCSPLCNLAQRTLWGAAVRRLDLAGCQLSYTIS